jgi:hypothetical protein
MLQTVQSPTYRTPLPGKDRTGEGIGRGGVTEIQGRRILFIVIHIDRQDRPDKVAEIGRRPYLVSLPGDMWPGRVDDRGA